MRTHHAQPHGTPPLPPYLPPAPSVPPPQVDLVHGLMVGRWQDDAWVAATTSAAARLLAQPASRAALLAHPEVAARCAELLHHPAREVLRGWGGVG